MSFNTLVNNIKNTLLTRSIFNLNEQAKPSISTEELQGMLSYPDIRPCVFDQTFDFWLARLERYGKVTITHIDPEFKTKKIVDKRKFINLVTDEALNKVIGLFGVEQISATQCKLYREYLGVNNKKLKEEFIVDIEIEKK